MKSILALLVFVCLASHCLAVSSNLIIGNHQYNEKLIYDERISESASWIGKKVIVTRQVVAPGNGIITAIECYDEGNNGAEATVTGGGPDYNTVSLRFKSQRLHGVYFHCQVYAKQR